MTTPRRALSAAAPVATLIALALAGPGAAAPAADVTLMPLGQSELAGLAAGLSPSIGGPETAALAAISSSVPCRSPAGVRRSGWRAGSRLAFVDPTGRVLRRRHGVFLAGTAVERYAGRAAAARALGAEALGDRLQIGVSTDAGGRILSFRAERVTTASGRGWLVRESVGERGPRLWATSLYARHGRYLLAIGIIRTDARSERAAAVRAMARLVTRVDGVESGIVKDAPDGAPAGGNGTLARGRVAGPSLPRMALRPADLRVPGFVAGSGYASRQPFSPTWVEQLQSACHADQPGTVTLTLTRLPNEGLARRIYRLSYRQLRASLRPRAIVHSSAGLARSARVSRLPSHVADVRSRLFLTRTRGPLGPMDHLLAIAQIRRVVAVLEVDGRGDARLSARDADRLLEILARRVHARLRAPGSGRR